MKNFLKRISLFCLLVLLATCKKDKDKVTEEQLLTQHEQKIIDKIDVFMPKEIESMFNDKFNSIRGEKDYAIYLDSIDTAIDDLKNAIQLNFSLNDYKKALSNSLTTLGSSSKGSVNNCLGLGYAKGVRLEGGLSGSVGSVIVLGLQASGGGGIKTIYDFVNHERQIYTYTICGSGVSFGAGLAAALNTNVGFSGINEIAGSRHNRLLSFRSLHPCHLIRYG